MENHLSLLLESLLTLNRKPVGIKFLLSDLDYANSSAPEYESGMPYCTAVKNASKGSIYKMNAENSSCIAASRALGLMPNDQSSSSGERHAKLGVYKNLCVSRSVAKDMVYCKHSCKGVEIRPLEDYREYPPDIVILITFPFNAMRIIQGYAYHWGQLKHIKMAGMCGICQECTSYPYETNSVNISMLCSGTRCVAQWTENELGIGFPFHYFESILDGLMKTVNPMENNRNKEKIIQNLSFNHLDGSMEIQLNSNYYRGAYGTPKQKNLQNQDHHFKELSPE